MIQTALPQKNIGEDCQTRTAKKEDAAALQRLIQTHMLFEKSSLTAPPSQAKIITSLIENQDQILCLVAETDKSLVGYATCSKEFSSWQCNYYLHMDCLYLVEEMRNRGIGRKIFRHITDYAKTQGITEIQWQTPTDNGPAIAFYQKLGARFLEKKRFSIQL